MYIAQHFILPQLNPFGLSVGGDGCLSTLCQGSWFDYQHRVLKNFPGSAIIWKISETYFSFHVKYGKKSLHGKSSTSVFLGQNFYFSSRAEH